MKKHKKSTWACASEVLDVALAIVTERGTLNDSTYADLLSKAIESLEDVANYAFEKSLKKKERKEHSG